MSHFADNLRELMRRRRLSQRELADSVGLSQAMVHRWVHAKNNPDFEQVAEVFDIPLDMLISVDINSISDREIEQRRALARAIGMVGVEEATRRILVAGSAASGPVPLEVKDETGSRKVPKGRGRTG